MKLGFLWLFLLSISLHSIAQKNRLQFVVDSLIKISLTQPQDSNQCMRYCNIGATYRQLETSKAAYWIHKGITLSQQLHYTNGLKCGYNNLGIVLYTSGKYKEAITAFSNYKNVCLESNDSINLAWSYNNIGNIYIDLAQFQTTITYYDSALTIRKLLHDSSAIAQSYTNFGYIYKEQGNYTSALLSLYQALKILEPQKTNNSLAYTYDFIGSVYAAKKNYSYSIPFYRKALALYQQANNRSGEAIALNSIGTNYYGLNQKEVGKTYLQAAKNIYEELSDVRQLAIINSTLSEIYFEENKPDSAVILAQQSIKYHLQNDTKRQLGGAYLHLAKGYLALHKYQDALNYAQIALNYAHQAGERNSEKTILQSLSEIAAKLGKYDEAYAYRLKYDTVKDSLINEHSETVIAELHTLYETEKKDLEIKHKTLELKTTSAELDRKQWQLVIALTGILMLIVVGYLLYNRNKLKQQQQLDAEIITQQGLRSKAIIEAEEKERIRIARELHDGIGQQLSAAKMNLSAFENNINPEDKDSYRILIQLVDDAVKEVRSISHNMMPNALLRTGLGSAVRDFVNKISISDSLKIDLQIVGINNRLENTTETVLYRVLQECVSNIIKHAHASHISIQLIQHDTHLNMLIEDNGKGFDTKLINNAEGIGLKNMISRVQFLNGTIDFDSTPNNGTTVIIDVPIKTIPKT